MVGDCGLWLGIRQLFLVGCSALCCAVEEVEFSSILLTPRISKEIQNHPTLSGISNGHVTLLSLCNLSVKVNSHAVGQVSRWSFPHFPDGTFHRSNFSIFPASSVLSSGVFLAIP